MPESWEIVELQLGGDNSLRKDASVEAYSSAIPRLPRRACRVAEEVGFKPPTLPSEESRRQSVPMYTSFASGLSVSYKMIAVISCNPRVYPDFHAAPQACPTRATRD
jgi:hypothetical protein